MSDLGLPQVDLDAVSIDASVIARVPADVARQHRVVPIVAGETVLIVAMLDPMNIRAVDDLFFFTRLSIEPVIATADAMTRALAKYYP